MKNKLRRWVERKKKKRFNGCYRSPMSIFEVVLGMSHLHCGRGGEGKCRDHFQNEKKKKVVYHKVMIFCCCYFVKIIKLLNVMK